MACLLNTTGTPATVEISDMGVVFIHPVVNQELETSFSRSEINNSKDLRTAITNSEITVTYNGTLIDNTNVGDIGHMVAFMDLTDTPTTLVGQANKVLSVNPGETAIEFSTHVVDAHTIGGVDHTADTLANVNTKISDATLIDTADSRLSDARTPTSHNLGGAEHGSDTLANLNSKVSDATLINTTDSRLSDDRNDASAIHDNISAEISVITEKTSPVGADVLIIEDSAASNVKKRVQITNLPGGADADAIHDNVASEISVVTEKVTPVSGDFILIEDSAASNVKKRIQIGNLPSGAHLIRIKDVALNDGTTPYIQSTPATWTAIDSFIFRGSTEAGTITNIKALCHIGGGTSMDIRVYDKTNSLAVCTKSTIIDTVETIHDLGTVSNIPTGVAIFEIQQQATGSGAKARCSHISMLF